MIRIAYAGTARVSLGTAFIFRRLDNVTGEVDSTLGISPMKRTYGPALVVSVSLAVITLFACKAVANPIWPPDKPLPILDETTDTTFFLDGAPLTVILVLFVLNLAANAFWYGLILHIIASRTDGLSRSGQLKGWEFLSLVLLAVVAITIAGAMIDYYIVAQDAFFPSLGEWHRVLAWNPLRWAAGVGFIFVSVLIATRGLLLTSWTHSAVVAAVMALVSPAWWVLADIFGWLIPFATIALSVVVSPLLLRELVRLYLENAPLIQPPSSAA